MAFLYKPVINSQFAPSALPVTPQYVVPAGVVSTLGQLVLSNVSANQVSVTAHIVPSGGSAGPSNRFINARLIAAGGSYVSPELFIQSLNAGDAVYIFASAANAVSIRLSARERS